MIDTIFFTMDKTFGRRDDKSRENAYIEAIAIRLRAKGFKTINGGIGPNTHSRTLLDGKVPKGALKVDIFNGADAGVIYEKLQDWYKRMITKGNHKVVINYCCNAKIKGVKWLKRAHDDNYDPDSFTGIANPDKTLLNNGYYFIEGDDPDEIANYIMGIINGTQITPIKIDCTNVWLLKGSKGDLVEQFQDILKIKGYYKGYLTDGDFGPFMESEVKRFQKDQKMKITDPSNWGVIGPNTCKLLQK